MSKIPEHLYHYTVGPKLPLIAQSGILRTTGFGAAPKEKPVLWLSENPQWEPTANKAMSVDGCKTFFRPSLLELQKSVGIFRFRIDTRRLAGLDPDLRLVPWSQIGSAARIAPSEIAEMVRRGMSWGATPTHWWGCMGSIPISVEEDGALIIEAREPVEVGQQQQWVKVTMEQAIASFVSRGNRVAMTTATEMPGARNV